MIILFYFSSLIAVSVINELFWRAKQLGSQTPSFGLLFVSKHQHLSHRFHYNWRRGRGSLHQTRGRPDVWDHAGWYRLQDYPLYKIKLLQLVNRFKASYIIHHNFLNPNSGPDLVSSAGGFSHKSRFILLIIFTSTFYKPSVSPYFWLTRPPPPSSSAGWWSWSPPARRGRCRAASPTPPWTASHQTPWAKSRQCSVSSRGCTLSVGRGPTS